MDRGATRLGAGAMALAAVWIVFFWWTPPEIQNAAPRVSFGKAPDQQLPTEPAPLEPASKPADVVAPFVALNHAIPAVEIKRIAGDGIDMQRTIVEQVEPPRVPEPNEPEPMLRYTVHAGDTLSEIAKEFYGRSAKWRIIRDANLDLVGQEGRLLQPGQILVIPKDSSGDR